MDDDIRERIDSLKFDLKKCTELMASIYDTLKQNKCNETEIKFIMLSIMDIEMMGTIAFVFNRLKDKE